MKDAHRLLLDRRQLPMALHRTENIVFAKVSMSEITEFASKQPESQEGRQRLPLDHR